MEGKSDHKTTESRKWSEELQIMPKHGTVHAYNQTCPKLDLEHIGHKFGCQ